MGYKALVTLDLPGATKDQREIFYQVLKDEKWGKINNLDTAWRVSFSDGATRLGAINTLESDLRKAKDKSKVSKVYYAIQLDTNELTISNL